ncbi:MAG: Ni/Fe hydrogenase subunit alpha, partial [bacterium]
CRIEIPEAPRFFEAMVRGKRYDDVHLIVSRICGICAVSHSTAALRATENALGIEPSEQTRLIRKLNFYGEVFSSHILHYYFLVAPDALNVPSVIPLVQTHKDVVLRALRLKKMGNIISDGLGGRHIHPISPTIGGFMKLPDEKILREIKKALEEARADFQATIDLFKTLKFPEFARKTEYVCLRKPQEYTYIDGVIASSDGDEREIARYKEKAQEFIVPHSTAKRTHGNRESYMVGALARVNNNFKLLSPWAKKVAAELGLAIPCYNPYLNTVAQLVETIDAWERSMEIVDELLTKGVKEEKPEVVIRAGKGAGAVEAPRGILFHEYEFDEKGYCVAANCIIPTGQNLHNLELDMKALVPQIADRSKEEITKLLEMLVRAYDPCISCSTHFLNIDFIE